MAVPYTAVWRCIHNFNAAVHDDRVPDRQMFYVQVILYGRDLLIASYADKPTEEALAPGTVSHTPFAAAHPSLCDRFSEGLYHVS